MNLAFVGYAMVAALVTCMTQLGWVTPTAPDISGVLSADPLVVQQTLTALRDTGPSGLTALLEQYDKSPDPRLSAGD